MTHGEAQKQSASAPKGKGVWQSLKKSNLVGIGVVFLVAIPTWADQITTAPGFGPWQQGIGGEFTVTPDAALAAQLGTYSPFTMNQGGFLGSFQTFCMERNEYIIANTTYDVTLNNVTVFTGDPLSAGAAYLYEQFATGQLTDLGNVSYNYANIPVGGRTTVGFADALMLQNALWYLMNPALFGGQAGNPYVVKATAVLGNPFAADNGAHHVSILNLWTPGQPHDAQHTWQDVLVYTGVPEPSALALVAMAGLFACRRKK
jgi:hypothetical protein